MKKKKQLLFLVEDKIVRHVYFDNRAFAEVEAVTFNYNQRHKLEIDCHGGNCKELGIKHTVLDMSLLNQLAPNALTRTDMEIT